MQHNLRGPTGPATQVLRPIFDMYMDAAVAVVGCRAKGIQRESCEWDVVVVTNERRPPTSISLGGVFVDLSFVSEREAMNPSDPERAVSMAVAKPVRDSGLLLSTSSAANLAVISESAKKAGTTRLSSAIKTLGRAEEAMDGEFLPEADFWLLAGAYEFAYAWAYSKEEIPSPSHLLWQLKAFSKGALKHFEAFSKGAGLEKASRAGCGSRLEGLEVLHDVVRSGLHGKGAAHSAWPKARLEIVGGKARELAAKIELAECYSYMGQELVDYIQAITAKGPKGAPSVRQLFSPSEPVLAGRLVKGLGLSRNKQALQKGLELLRDEVADLAREI